MLGKYMGLGESKSVGVKEVRGHPKTLDTYQQTYSFPTFYAASHRVNLRRVSTIVDA
jgi:hypothetical protein